MHESEHIALMNRVADIFVNFHKCTREFADWKVRELPVSELLLCIKNFEEKTSCNSH